MKTTSARFSAFVLLGTAALFVTACGDDASSVSAPPASGGAAGKAGAGGANAGAAGKAGAAGGGAGSAAKGGSAGTSAGGAAGTSAGGKSGSSAGGAAGTTAGGTNGGGATGTTAAGSGGAAGTTTGGAAGSGAGGTSAGAAGAGNGGTNAGGTSSAGNGGTGAGGSGGTSAGGTDAGGNGGTSAGGTDAGGNGGTSGGGTSGAGNGGANAGGSAGSSGGSAGAGGSNPQARPNKMFVTSSTITLSSFNGRGAGDSLCQKLAESAGLPNVDQYRVWLSDKTTDARQALGNARGWVRTDNLPFADTVGDLANGKIFYPPRLDENGKDLGADIKVITGTKEDGTKAPNEICDGWVGTGNVRIGDGNRTTEAWTSSSSDGCSGTAHLYCFEKTNDVPVAPTPLPKSAKVIFVSRAAFLPGPGGRTTADDDCAKEAKAAQLPGDYVALLPLGKEGALERVPANDLTWYRPDGVVVAKADLKQTRLTAPPNVTANGAGYIGSARKIVTGIVGNFGAEPGLQCVAWTKTQGDPASGVATVTAQANETDESWHTAATDICDHEKAAVYCVSKK